MVPDLAIPYAWKTVVETDEKIRRLYVLTTLAQHPRVPGFDAEAKRKLSKAATTAAAEHALEVFVLWQISPPPDVAQHFDAFLNHRAQPVLDHHRRRRND